MQAKIILLLPLFAASLLAQRPAPVEHTDVTRNAGLHADGANGLVGGGEHYAVKFGNSGARFIPALGTAAPTLQHLELQPTDIRRGGEVVFDGPFDTTPRQGELRANFAHTTGIEERYDVGVDGMEVSWKFAQRPAGAGDLVVRYAIDTTLPSPTRTAANGLEFAHPDYGGVQIGGVTGIDANGATMAGTLRFANGYLEMALPADFVERATYPLVLDPLVGPKINVDTTTWPDAEPDTCYEAATDNYLVTYMRTFAGNVQWPRAQLVDVDGNLVGGTIYPSLNGTCGRARVASLRAYERFGIVFEETDGLFNGILFRAIDAVTGAISHPTVLATSTGIDLFSSPDIAGSSHPIQTSSARFVIVFEDNIQNEIRARALWFNSLDNVVSPAAVTVEADTGGIGSSYTQPAISRCVGNDRVLMVASRRFSGIGPTLGVRVSALHTTSMTVQHSTTLGNSITDSIAAPDVDGFEGTWVVAWQRAASALSAPGIRRQSLQYNSTTGFSLASTFDLGGSTLFQASAPTLGYAPGRTWLGHRYFNGFGGSNYSLRAGSLDTQSGEWCNTELVESITSADTRIVVATAASGGVPSREDALCVFAENDNVYAQVLINHGTAGTTVNLGGGCGPGGSQYFSHEPGIGSSTIVCGVTGLPISAIATVFNFAPPTGTVPCGPCVWTPFFVTETQITTTTVAHVAFPIPCLPGLIGAQYEIQWTTLVPGEVPCPFFPDVVLSDRWLMTIGN